MKSPSWLRWSLIALGVTVGLGTRADPAEPVVHGLPFIRSYALGDIGAVPRGSQLGFDRFGRVAVIHDAVYAVLNDSAWLNIAEPGGKDRVPMENVVVAADGRSYYGARASWGYVDHGTDGLLHPVPLVPADQPNWIASASFKDIVTTQDGVYFVSWYGVVFWDFRRRQSHMFEVPKISCVFRIANRVYISAYESELRYIDVDTVSLKSAGGTDLDGKVVVLAATQDSAHCLVSLTDGRLLAFDGRRLSPWLKPGDTPIHGRVSILQQLVDGQIAVGVTGQGLLLFSPEGELRLGLTTSRYSNISAVANREPGVLWVETEDAIEKILYGNPLSAFGETLGLPVNWPLVVRWNGQLLVASGSNLYRAVPGTPGEPTRFEVDKNQPPGGVYSLSAWGSHMLVGNGSALYSAEVDGTYRQIPSVGDLMFLVMVDPDHCYAIGRSEIALLAWQDGRWRDAVPRIPGVHNPLVVHRVKKSVWIEMGGDGVARVSLQQGRLQLKVVPNNTWTTGSWVNVGAVGPIVVLSSLHEEPRRFFNEDTGTWCDAAWLEQLLNRSPYWIARAQQDETGVIWATHNEGLVRFAPNGSDYTMDASSFDLVNDRYPVIRVLPGNDVWMLTQRSLYHIERTWGTTAPRPAKPVLVSMLDLQNNTELLTTRFSSSLRLPYERNGLSFRFYSGSDAWRRAPQYEYRLNETEPWTAFDGSLLSLRGIHEGNYRLQIRMVSGRGAPEVSVVYGFEILAPWTRSWTAYSCFAVGAMLVLLGAMRWSSYIERKRSRMLESVVRERTHQLESTMAKLNEETRNAATLIERNRLANEIHDSVQQGLTGAMLQLDTTLKLPVVAGDVRKRLDVVRNMVSYARQEVQNAVWDIESPLLEGNNLADALRNLTTFVNSGDAEIDVSVQGAAVPLSRDVSHNLLRIAQEATTNAFRHASAKRISIRLAYEPNPQCVTLEVSDDGTGFCVNDVLQKPTGHLGLRGIRARVKRIGGELKITSEPLAGTTIRVTVRCTNHQDESCDATAD